MKKNLKGMKGLIIHDEPSFIDSECKLLEFQGCEIMTATDAKTALPIIGDRDFDFVICDIRMPDTNGIEFYSIIKKKTPCMRDRISF